MAIGGLLANIILATWLLVSLAANKDWQAINQGNLLTNYHYLGAICENL